MKGADGATVGGADLSAGHNNKNPLCLPARAALVLMTEPGGGKRSCEAGGGVCRSMLRLALMNMRPPKDTGWGDQGAAPP